MTTKTYIIIPNISQKVYYTELDEQGILIRSFFVEYNDEIHSLENQWAISSGKKYKESYMSNFNKKWPGEIDDLMLNVLSNEIHVLIDPDYQPKTETITIDECVYIAAEE